MQTPPEMKLFERKHLGMRLFHQNENDWLLLIGSFSETKFYFFLPTMKSNVNRIYFIVGWNFISGRCHFGSQVNTLLVFSVYEGTEQNMGVFAQVKVLEIIVSHDRVTMLLVQSQLPNCHLLVQQWKHQNNV